MSTVEFLPEGAVQSRSEAVPIYWPLPSGATSEHAIIDADPSFSQMGVIPPAAVDLGRVAIGAYLSDRMLPRSSVRWARDIELVVHMLEPAAFSPAIELCQKLLHWVSGDNWTIIPISGETERSEPSSKRTASEVSLLSGGLDSLCGALLAPEGTVFLGQRDSKAVAHAQALLRTDLEAIRPPFEYIQLRVQAIGPGELSSRSRSIMFMALGTVLAAGRDAATLFVPENGFTSLNPPLAANRGGPRTTRSTHPTTFAYANAINQCLGLPVILDNPYRWMTKGDLVSAAAAASGSDVLEDIIPHTFSCARANGHFFEGGSAFLNCGVCVACMTRRGSVRAAGLEDRTEYLVDRLAGDSRTKFLSERGGDLSVVRTLHGWRPNEATLVSMGPFPNDFDFDRGLELLARGVEELVNGLP
jgi:7-cyano-7-deazaguanine synthase in queuosine biosynthesis